MKAGTPRATTRRMLPIRTILLATDFGPASEAACDAALELGEALKANVTLLHVWDVPAMAYSEGPLSILVDAAPLIQRAAERELCDKLALCKSRYVQVDSELRRGSAWEQIHRGVHGPPRGPSGDRHARAARSHARVGGKRGREGRAHVRRSRAHAPEPLVTLKKAALVALVAALSSVAGYTLYHSRVAITPMITLKSLLAPI